MPEVTNISTISKGVTDLARDVAYVAVGLGVLGYQRAQVQRIELKNKLAKDFSLDTSRISGVAGSVKDNVLGARTNVRGNVAKSIKQIDGLADTAANFVESTLQPLEERLPSQITDLTSKAREQARGVRSQIMQRVASA
jgi:DNA-binding helix-hairpin-helix protein with protein kinase domain